MHFSTERIPSALKDPEVLALKSKFSTILIAA